MCVHDPRCLASLSTIGYPPDRFMPLPCSILCLKVLYLLTLLFQPVLFGYFACPFHLSINFIVTLGVLRSSIMSSMSVLVRRFLFFFTIVNNTLCAAFCIPSFMFVHKISTLSFSYSCTYTQIHILLHDMTI